MSNKTEYIVLDDSELEIKHYDHLRKEVEKKQISKMKDKNLKDSVDQQKPMVDTYPGASKKT